MQLKTNVGRALVARYPSVVDLLEAEPLCQKMQDCRDRVHSVFAFGKTHRPEERAKVIAARTRLAELERLSPGRREALAYLWKMGRY